MTIDSKANSSSTTSTSPAAADAPILPGAWPLLGHFVPVLRAGLLNFLVAARDAGPVVVVRLGPLRAYLINDHHLVRRVLVIDAASYVRGRVFQQARDFLGNGLVTSEGDFHRRQRRLVQPAFHRERIRNYAAIMQRFVAERSEQWRHGQTIQVDTEMAELVATITAACLFNSPLTATAAAEVSRAMAVLSPQVMVRALAPSFFNRIPTPSNRRYAAANTRLHSVIAEVIRAYRAAGVDHGDMLSMLLAAQDEDTGERMDDQQVHDEVATIVVAGIETSAGALAWAFHEIGGLPDVENRLHTEVDQVLGGRPPTYEDVSNLPYTRGVFLEAARLYTFPLLLRQARCNTTLGGVRIPAGSHIAYSPYALLRDPVMYPSPETFDPGRWLPECASQLSREGYTPFSVGAHKCIGDTFAQSEGTLVLATLASRWRLRPASRRRVRMIAAGTVRPSHLPMIATQRHRGE